MPLVVKDRVRETSTSTGTGTISLGGAGAGFQSFSVIGDGNTTFYTIADAATGDFEVGIGTYTAAGAILSRDVVLESSSGGTAINFAAGPKDVFVTYPAERSVYVDGSTITPAVAATLPVVSGGTGAAALTANNVILGNGTSSVQFVAPGGSGNVLTSTGASWASQALAIPDPIPSGTVMLFVQTAAPTGWTKSTAHDNKALRVVSGTAGSGGTVAFTTAFSASNTVDGHVITIAQLPSHNHTFSATTGNNNVGHNHGVSGTTATNNASHAHTVSGTTGTQTLNHNHTFNVNSQNNNVVHQHALTGNAVAATNAFFVGTGGSVSLGGGTAIGSTLNNSNTHVHPVSGTTSNNSQSHQHSFSATTATQNANHAHTFNVTSAGNSVNHNHAVSGTTSSVGSGSAHSHTTTNFAVQYVDVIIATKD